MLVLIIYKSLTQVRYGNTLWELLTYMYDLPFRVLEFNITLITGDVSIVPPDSRNDALK